MTIFIVAVAIIALLFALYLSKSVLKESMGNDKMKEISEAVQEGAMAFLNRQYKTIFPIAIVIIVLLLFTEFGAASAIAFGVGALFSTLAQARQEELVVWAAVPMDEA